MGARISGISNRLECEPDLPAALEFLRRMVAINSFTANAEGVNAVGRVVAEAFAPLGFRERRVPSSHVEWGDHLFLVGESRASRPTIALISHLDTVYPAEEEARNDFAWWREGSRIHGPGTNDIKGGTMLAWLMLTAMKREWPAVFDSANWIVAFNACEEEDSEDFGGACLEVLPRETAACLVLEGDGGVRGDHRVVVQRKGRATFRISVSGRGAHAGSRHAFGANAIVEISRVLCEVAALTDYEKGVTVNVGSVRGGTVVNRVPHEAEAELEMRAWESDAFESAKAAILAFSGKGQSASEDGYRCRIESAVLDEITPWPANAATAKLAQHWLDAGRELGTKIETQARGGLSDANALWNHFPTLDGLGPCGDFAHCSEKSADGSKQQEWVDADSFVPKAQINATAISRLLAAISG